MEEDILSGTVSLSDLKKFEALYYSELKSSGVVNRDTQFSYAWCLVRSQYPADIRKGIIILEELFKSDETVGAESPKRDYLYYLALGNARIKEYTTALHYTKLFLQIEPSNHQVASLEALVKKKLETEGLKGMALAGGALLTLGSIIGLGYALSKGKK